MPNQGWHTGEAHLERELRIEGDALCSIRGHRLGKEEEVEPWPAVGTPVTVLARRPEDTPVTVLARRPEAGARAMVASKKGS